MPPLNACMLAIAGLLAGGFARLQGIKTVCVLGTEGKCAGGRTFLCAGFCSLQLVGLALLQQYKSVFQQDVPYTVGSTGLVCTLCGLSHNRLCSTLMRRGSTSQLPLCLLPCVMQLHPVYQSRLPCIIVCGVYLQGYVHGRATPEPCVVWIHHHCALRTDLKCLLEIV